MSFSISAYFDDEGKQDGVWIAKDSLKSGHQEIQLDAKEWQELQQQIMFELMNRAFK